MNDMTNYLLRSSLGTIAVLVAFVGLGVIAVVLEAITWDTLGDWTVKAVLVAGVVVAISAVMGWLGYFAKSRK